MSVNAGRLDYEMSDDYEARAAAKDDAIVKIFTRVGISLVLLATVLCGGCVGEIYVKGKICVALLTAQGVPDTAKAQFLQSGACMSFSGLNGR